jgi:hypothetical protein
MNLLKGKHHHHTFILALQHEIIQSHNILKHNHIL